MQERRVKLATTECKTHWSNVDTRSYTALDFILHDSHMLITIIFMRPLGRVGIYCVLLYNLYSGVWVTYVLYKKYVQVVFVELAQARLNYGSYKIRSFDKTYLHLVVVLYHVFHAE